MAVWSACRNAWGAGAALGAALAFGVPASAQPLGGDGSGANNPDLLRGGYEAGCTSPAICATSGTESGQTYDAPVNLAEPAPTKSPGQPEPRPQPAFVAQPAFSTAPAAAPPEDAGPALEADWRVTLRGSYETGTRGQTLGIAILPEVSLARQTRRGRLALGAEAELVREDADQYRLARTALDFDAETALSRDTELSGGAQLTLSQDGPDDPGVGSDVDMPPLIGTGEVDAALNHRAGRFGIEVRGNALRQLHGDTELEGGGTRSNAYRDRYGFGGAVRGLYRVGGHVDMFVEGSTERDIYDAASPAYGTTLDSWTHAVRAGVTGNWDEVVTAEISAGYGLRRFDSDLLDDVPTALLDAELVYRPDDAVEFAARLGTDITAADAADNASAEIAYTAGADWRYMVNDRMTMRASVGGEWTEFADSGETGQSYSAGVGADFNVNAHTSLSADYAYEVSDGSDAARADSHTVSVGMTLSR